MDVSSKAANDFLSFVNASPTPFHAVRSAKQRLVRAGFKEIKERDAWASVCQPGGKYYLTRNASTILAFAIGKKWKPGNPIAMIGAHTDSPCLRIKPVSKKQSDGFLQVGVETYGGGLWHTWFDRDLSIAGRAMIKTAKGDYVQKLVKVDRPILRIPTLAIHLDRQEKFEFNKEAQLFPIAGLVAAELDRQGTTGIVAKPKPSENGTETEPKMPFEPLKVLTERHHPYVIELIATEAGVNASDVVDFEIILYDTQKACIGGLNSELIFSARLDNLGMSYCSTMGLINSLVSSSALEDESSIRLISLFDHEEIGSQTAQGADSNLLPSIIRRLSVLPSTQEFDANIPTAYEQTLSSSFLISADMAHSVHPNYPGKYESEHRPEMNKGTVIKINANARYATNSPGIVLLQEVARRQNVPLQLFVVRNDSSCGSTIGPMLSAALGVRTLDLGNPQLSMHSIRETGGVYDVEYGIKLFESFFEHYSDLEGKIFVD
ncbi:aspartyl aminopeptidase [Lasallia pustulata]|uniref:aspartyl aminopeptidase n=1 Tax=Lasallia pustulata TaxID=136370 RepID=A0A1W5CU86_9LECA|nr:aspartyl aminopeptidase [Lasallia pustulata]